MDKVNPRIIVVNSQRTFAVRVTVVVPCVCVRVCMRACIHVCVCLPVRRYQRFCCNAEKDFLSWFSLKMLRSEAMASFTCLRCHQLHLNPKRRIPKESTEGWKDIDIRDFNFKKCLCSAVTVHSLTPTISLSCTTEYIAIYMYLSCISQCSQYYAPCMPFCLIKGMHVIFIMPAGLLLYAGVASKFVITTT